MIRRISGLAGLLDGPTRARDMSALFTPGLLAVWFMLLHATIGIGLAGMLYAAAAGEGGALVVASSTLGLGQYLAVALLLSFGALLTLVVPLRAVGVIEQPRLGRYFDQVVLSGVSPLRLYGGRFFLTNAFCLLLAAGALPYAIFALSLGGTQADYVIRGFVALIVYANVLSLLTMVIGLFVHEVVAALAVAGAAGLAYAISLSPVPMPLLGALTPSRMLVEPYWRATGGFEYLSRQFLQPPDAPNELLATLTQFDPFAMYLAGAAIIAVILTAALLVGPAHCLVHETGAFGEVVMDGDTRRPGVLRRRFQLRRRAEVAFLYENTQAWARRWEAPLRYGVLLAVCAFAAVWGSATLVGLAPFVEPEPYYSCALTELIILLGLGTFCFTADRSTLGSRVGCGRWRPAVALLDPIAFLLVTLAAYGATFHLAAVLEDHGCLWRVGKLPSAWPERTRWWIERTRDIEVPLYILCALQTYTLAQILACRAWSRIGGLLSAVGLMFALWMLPWMAALTLLDLHRYRGPYLGLIGLLASTSGVCPLTIIYGGGNAKLRAFLRDHTDLTTSVIFQLALTAVFLLFALSRRRRSVATGAEVVR